jgi:type VI secretion system protein VasI
MAIARFFICFFAASSLSLAPSVLHAQDAAACASKKIDAERLECYDLAFKKNVHVSAESKWNVRVETSKIDDSKTVFLDVDSAETLRNQYGQMSRANLTIACREGVTDIWIQMGGYFLASTGGFGEVTVRIDKRPAKKLHFLESTDHKALGLWRSSGIPFIREMLNGNSMFVRITPFSESAVTAEFPIVGLSEAIKPLATACKWQASKK